MNDLKPCPFCGDKPEMEWVQHNSVKPDTVLTYCCYISIESSTEEKAIKAWNTRPPTVEEVEADFYKASEKIMEGKDKQQ